MDITPGLFILKLHKQDHAEAELIGIGQEGSFSKASYPSKLDGTTVAFGSSQQTQKKNPWDDLHNGTVKDELSLSVWEAQIPNYGCGCRNFYLEYKANNPPDFSSEDALWVWGVGLHNAVNKKLDRLELSLDEARKIWNR